MECTQVLIFLNSAIIIAVMGDVMHVNKLLFSLHAKHHG